MPVIIKSTKDGFRRCNEAHKKGAVTWPDGHFTERELERLKDEPKLSVEIVRESEADPGNSGKEPGFDPKIIAAARRAVKDGDTIGSGAPDIRAMEKILGKNLTAADRDDVWEIIQTETAGGKE